MIEIFFLSIIQGITEFLPVSSSSHLILISNYIKFESQSLAIDVSLHIGSFFAVITYFRKDIYNLYDKVSEMEKVVQKNQITVNIINRISWIIITGVVGGFGTVITYLFNK